MCDPFFILFLFCFYRALFEIFLFKKNFALESRTGLGGGPGYTRTNYYFKDELLNREMHSLTCDDF